MLGVSFFIQKGFPLYMLSLVGLVFLIGFVNKPILLLSMIIMTYNSGLKLPGMTTALTLSDFLAMLLVFLAIAGGALRKSRKSGWSFPQLCILVFMALLLGIIAVRGAGFRFLGDSRWGGLRYVSLFLGGLFYVSITSVKMDSKVWIRSIRWMFVLGLLPLLAEGIFLMSRGVIYHHYTFFNFSGSTGINFQDFAMGEEGIRRLQTALIGGESLLLLALAFFWHSERKDRRWFFWILIGAAAILMAVSGHRIAMLRLFGVIWLYFWILNKGKRFHFVSVSMGLFCLGVAFLYIVAPLLPLPAQRMVAILPGVDIDPMVRLSANSTSEWRITLWLDAIQEIPDYLLVGKGFTFSGTFREMLALAGQEEYVRSWAIESSSYHNGILSLLIGTGLPGLLIGTAFLLGGLRRYYRILCTLREDRTMHAISLALYCSVLVTIMLYFTVYGDVFVSFPPILFYFALLEGLAASRRRSQIPESVPNPDSTAFASRHIPGLT